MINGDKIWDNKYVGLDIYQDITHVCVVDRDSNRLWEGSCESTPEGIGATIKKHAPEALKIGLESRMAETRRRHRLWRGLGSRQPGSAAQNAPESK